MQAPCNCRHACQSVTSCKPLHAGLRSSLGAAHRSANSCTRPSPLPLCPHLRPVQRITGPMAGALMRRDSNTKADAHSTTSKLASSAIGGVGSSRWGAVRWHGCGSLHSAALHGPARSRHQHASRLHRAPQEHTHNHSSLAHYTHSQAGSLVYESGWLTSQPPPLIGMQAPHQAAGNLSCAHPRALLCRSRCG